jgi:hypothetical protein
MRRLVLTGLLLAGLGFLGCDSETISGPIADVYFLEAVNNTNPPYLLSVDAKERRYLVNESLTFSKDGTVEIRSSIRIEDIAAGTVKVENVETSADYRITDNSIEIGRFTICPPAAVCISNDSGSITSERIVLKSYRYPSNPTLAFHLAPEL